MTKPISVIWQTEPGAQTEFEKEYLARELLAPLGVAYDEVFDGQWKEFGHRVIVFVSADNWWQERQIAQYLGRFPLDARIVLVHLSNERTHLGLKMYGRPDLILRQYYSRKYAWRRNLIFFPLGFRSGLNDPHVSGRQPSFDSRTYTWSFIGQIKSDRAEMLAALGRLGGPAYTHLTTGWLSQDQLGVGDYAAILRATKYVPCPRGNDSLDTFRITEALESGAIPVVVDPTSYFHHTFGAHRFISASSWQTAGRLIDTLEEGGGGADVSRACTEWYEIFCYRQRARRSNRILDALMAEAERSPVDQSHQPNARDLAKDSLSDVVRIARLVARR